jgi:hypothetical protein
LRHQILLPSLVSSVWIEFFVFSLLVAARSSSRYSIGSSNRVVPSLLPRLDRCLRLDYAEAAVVGSLPRPRPWSAPLDLPPPPSSSTSVRHCGSSLTVVVGSSFKWYPSAFVLAWIDSTPLAAFIKINLTPVIAFIVIDSIPAGAFAQLDLNLGSGRLGMFRSTLARLNAQLGLFRSILAQLHARLGCFGSVYFGSAQLGRLGSARMLLDQQRC